MVNRSHLAGEHGGECQEEPGETEFDWSSGGHLCHRVDGERTGDEVKGPQICSDDQRPHKCL